MRECCNTICNFDIIQICINFIAYGILRVYLSVSQFRVQDPPAGGVPPVLPHAPQEDGVVQQVGAGGQEPQGHDGQE